MRKNPILVIVLAALLWSSLFSQAKGSENQSLFDQASADVRKRIEAAATAASARVGEEPIRSAALLRRFYEKHRYRPAWSGDHSLVSQAYALVKTLGEAGREGLNPTGYHLFKLETMLAQARADQLAGKPLEPRVLADLDVLLTDAFLSYGSHLSTGRINPRKLGWTGVVQSRRLDLVQALGNALGRNQVEAALQSFLPLQPGYGRLRVALARYRNIASSSSWPKVPDGPKMKKGDSGERVKLLRARLTASGDLVHSTGCEGGDLFDAALEQALQEFQRRHGLEVDGILGRFTLAELNVSPQERTRQIELNMERWRWLPEEFGKRHITINIAGFELKVVEDDQTVMHMRIVAGLPNWRTPLFSDQLVSVVFNPYWNIPARIASRETLPAIRENPHYLAEKNIKVFEAGENAATQVDPSRIDWSKVSPDNLRYRFRQEPGPGNSLGRLRFSFAQYRDIHLHDTPARELFKKNLRAFSHGCMRIENPIELAEYLLRGDPGWTRERITKTIDGSLERTVRLPEPVPVHVLYWTAWVGEDGIVQFGNDIYKHDKRLEEALRREEFAP